MFGNLSILLVILSCAVVQASKDNATVKKALYTVHGRVADVYVPACANANSPILVSFHGLGFTKSEQPTYDRYNLDAERECAVVVYPQGGRRAVSVFGLAGYSWNAGGCCPDADVYSIDDVGFVDELVATVARDYGVNGDLVFASGISNGAMMANRYGCQSKRVKGVISVAGPLINGTGGKGHGEAFSCAHSVPTLYFHGTHDPIVPIGGCNRTWQSYGHICEELYKMGPGLPDAGFPAAKDFIADLRNLNGIGAADPGSVSFHNKSVTCTSWGESANNVTFCKLEGMGHAWPDKNTLCSLPWTTCDDDIDATNEAWRFIRNLRRQHAAAVIV